MTHLILLLGKQGGENKWASVNLETKSLFVWCLGVRLEKWNDPFWQQKKQGIFLSGKESVNIRQWTVLLVTSMKLGTSA